jgi:predicted dehydrogenase
MFERESLDVIAIATHPGSHRDIVLSALEHGVRAIFCEKPFSLTLDDADEMVAACREAGCVLGVDHSRRWHPAWLKARELLQSGAIGELVSMYTVCEGIKPEPSWQSEEEGPLLHDAVHAFDMFRFFAGDVRSVAGTALRRERPYRVEDDSQAIFEFEAGVSGVALVNELASYSRFIMELHGDEGLLLLQDDGPTLWTAVDITQKHRHEPESNIEWKKLVQQRFPEYPAWNALLEAYRELIQCLETDSEPSSTGEDGVASVEMVMGIYESQLRNNQSVALPLEERGSALYRLREAGQL